MHIFDTLMEKQPMKNYFKPKQLRLLVFLLCLTVLLSGCVYLRLLQVKNQLKEFDKHFAVQLDNGLIVHHLHPVLLSKDVHYLTKVDPSFVKQNSSGFTWTYRFEKLNKDEKTIEEGKPVIFDMVFNEKKRITQFKFHEIFLQLAPPKFIELSLRALGDAKVFKSQRKLDADPTVWEGEKLHAPLATQIIPKLGEPVNKKMEEEGLIVTYKYRLAVPEGKSYPEKKRLAEVRLTFDPKTEELNRLKANFAGMKLSVNYEKIIKRSKNQKPAQ